MDGLQATQEIRQFDPETPIIIVSSVQDPSWSSRARSVGANGLFAKPVTLAMVFAMLEDHTSEEEAASRRRRVSDPVVVGFNRDDEGVFGEHQFSESELGHSFHMAVWNGDRDLVRFLLKDQAELVNWADPTSGNCALHLAARIGDEIMLQLLLDAGAHPNQVSNKGYNAMHVAAWSGFLSCVTLLEGKGCDALQKVERALSSAMLFLFVPHVFAFSRLEALVFLTWPAWKSVLILQKKALFNVTSKLACLRSPKRHESFELVPSQHRILLDGDRGH